MQQILATLVHQDQCQLFVVSSFCCACWQIKSKFAVIGIVMNRTNAQSSWFVKTGWQFWIRLKCFTKYLNLVNINQLASIAATKAKQNKQAKKKAKPSTLPYRECFERTSYTKRVVCPFYPFSRLHDIKIFSSKQSHQQAWPHRSHTNINYRRLSYSWGAKVLLRDTTLQCTNAPHKLGLPDLTRSSHNIHRAFAK